MEKHDWTKELGYGFIYLIMALVIITEIIVAYTYF